MNIVDKGTISSEFRSKQITPIDLNKANKNINSGEDTTLNNNSKKNNESEKLEIKGPRYLKIIPSSGVIYRISGNKKEGNDIYKNKNGRMCYKEYLLLRKKYMETDYSYNTYHNNTVSTFQNIEEQKRKNKNKKDDDKKNLRNKSKTNIARTFKLNEFNSDNSENELNKIMKEKEKKLLYKTNLDENGKEVLNENLFKYKKTEYRPMRKTFTGKFFQKKGSQQNDKKGEVLFNFNNDFIDKKNNNAYKSYYGGFKNANVIKKNKF